jgi:hypothetical protein
MQLIEAVVGGGATTLLPIAVAAELSKGDRPATGQTAPGQNPLRGVLDLYAMGAVEFVV